VAARVYDYEVTYSGFSPYVHGEISPLERLRLTGGLRYDRISYDHENHLPAAAILVAPAAGTFPTGSRFYGQADDTKVNFSHASPKLGATWAFSKETHLYASRTYGFRAPSEGDLFRPSFGTSAAAAQFGAHGALTLKPIKADQSELGLRGQHGSLSYDLVVYQLEKRDDLVTQRDTATNFTQRVNAGLTRHRGVELGVGYALSNALRLDTAVSSAKHTYVEFVTGGGDLSGKEMESAPNVLANTRLTWLFAPRSRVQFEWVRVGEYWMDAANTAKYEGHDLFNLRADWGVTPGVSLFGSIYNLADKRHAESSSISSGTQVFSPGLPRMLYAGLEARW
jgi:outer membrane receptor protein involved in Fe transport